VPATSPTEADEKRLHEAGCIIAPPQGRVNKICRKCMKKKNLRRFFAIGVSSRCQGATRYERLWHHLLAP
jgi:hypothetical protein